MADDEYVADVMFDLTRNMGQRSQYVSIRHWPQRMAEWLEDRGYLRSASK